jgi:hypothetical protein
MDRNYPFKLGTKVPYTANSAYERLSLGGNMTYGELLQRLYELSPQQLQQDITIEFQGELFTAYGFMPNGHENEETDIVDAGSPIITVLA